VVTTILQNSDPWRCAAFVVEAIVQARVKVKEKARVKVKVKARVKEKEKGKAKERVRMKSIQDNVQAFVSAMQTI